MATPTLINPGAMRPFDALDAEWAMLCRRDRRSSVVADWARQHPALASAVRLDDVIPPAGVDRRPYCERSLLRAPTWRRGRCCSCSYPAWYAWRPGGAGSLRA
ncbi:MAG: hypothetical protein ACRD0R_19750 [Acidimicrobiales bacterium]